jgi:CheY-like chemotaxis protein
MKKMTVLIADDNEDVASGLRIQLLVHGYDVVTCANADLAVAHAHRHRPDVMLIDIWMDGDHRVILNAAGNGLSVLERINAFPETRGIPVIYMSGKDLPQFDLRAREMGAFGFIRKPINFSALLKLIESATSQSRPSCDAPPDARNNSEVEIAPACGCSEISKVQ